ncbi:MAG: hypothetical protein PHP23_15955 [Desulfobacterales bacterium]|nr:hypothetical protein [Desulfobacterales bacterium]MDD4073303.1 hypothetical protein [Desulfobacterales bacterium]MDD4392851.1 hypothetical protein [Desulfobacterales bacterium]
MPMIDIDSGKVIRLDSSVYADRADLAGMGLTTDCFREVSTRMGATKQTLSQLEVIISSQLPAPETGLQVENHASRHFQLMADLKSRFETNRNKPISRFQPDRLTPFESFSSLANEIQQSSRNVFSDPQSITLNKMVSDWLVLVRELITCAQNAEKELQRVVTEVDSARQARWKLVGNILGTVIKLAAPPPFGAIIGGVVQAVLTADTWTSCVTASAGSVMSATYPGQSNSWKYDEATGTWGGAVETTYNAVSTSPAPSGVSDLSGYSSVPQLLDGVPMIFAESKRKAFDKVNQKTLCHVTDLPAPPENMSGSAADTIRQQVQEKVRVIMTAVNETLAEYMSTIRTPTSLVWACWDYEKVNLIARARLARDSRMFIADHLKQSSRYYLNTLAHGIMTDLAARAKPRITVTDISEAAVQKQFEILMWAQYLATTGLDIKPKGKKHITDTSDESYHLDHYGKVKFNFWQSTIAAKLKQLGIIREFESVKAHFFSLKSRDPAYDTALSVWHPPQSGQPWSPIPYRLGGDRSSGRLAAWGVEYSLRPPEELFKAILG